MNEYPKAPNGTVGTKPLIEPQLCLTCRQTTQYFCESIIPKSANKSIELCCYFARLLPASLFEVLCAVLSILPGQHSKCQLCISSFHPLVSSMFHNICLFHDIVFLW